MSVRHFAEHAVAVEYCDYLPGASEAHLRRGVENGILQVA